MNRAMKRRTQKPRRVVRRKRPSVAIVHVQPAPVEKPWEITSEQLVILKNSIAKGASDDELKYCMEVARRYKLDPFKKQIWFVPRWDSQADNGNGGKGRIVWTPQVGIDGLLFTAARDHKKDFGSVSLPEYGPMELVEGQGKMKAPEWASVKVWKKGETEPTEAQAWWDEYAPSELNKAPFWRKMPRRMLAKCATALAIRQAYPDLGGLYISEEMERMAEEHSPSGRELVDNVPHGGSREAAQEVAKKKIEEYRLRIEAQKQEAEPGEPKGGIELDWSLTEQESLAGRIYAEFPVVRGDIAELLETLKLNLHMTWGADSCWHCEPRDAEKLMTICEHARYELKEILPAKFPAVAASKQPLPEKAAVEGGSMRGPSPSAVGSKVEEAPKAKVPANTSPVAASTVQKGTEVAKPVKPRSVTLPSARIPFLVKHVQRTPSGKGVEVTLDTGAKLYAFDNRKMGEDGEKLLDLLLADATGKECIFETVKKLTKEKHPFTNIVGLLQMGEREWDEQGVPILRREPAYQREPGED